MGVVLLSSLAAGSGAATLGTGVIGTIVAAVLSWVIWASLTSRNTSTCRSAITKIAISGAIGPAVTASYMGFLRRRYTLAAKPVPSSATASSTADRGVMLFRTFCRYFMFFLPAEYLCEASIQIIGCSTDAL